jgi:hypothetical protein
MYFFSVSSGGGKEEREIQKNKVSYSTPPYPSWIFAVCEWREEYYFLLSPTPAP